jgi:micrococcal nuclease
VPPTSAASPITAITPAPPTTTSPSPSGGELAQVISITDGDTIRVNYSGGSNEPVRLIGINSPESGECGASDATAALQVLIGGKTVTMVRDISDRDQYNRLLRYLYLSDGTFVNERLVRNGYALASEYPPDTAQASNLASAQTAAERDEVGMWATDGCGTASSANLAIIHIEYDAPGNDNDNLNGEWVEIKNQGTTSAGMVDWVLKDESASHRYTFPSGFALPAGLTVRVLTGCGTSTASELYWCNSGAIWNNSGDTAFLLDPNGNIHDQLSY